MDIESLTRFQRGCDNDRTSLLHWFPKLADAGLPVPKTITMQMPLEAIADFWNAMDMKPLTAASEPFFAKLDAAGRSLGVPYFLRSSHRSGKHAWSTSCFVADGDSVRDHAFNIAYESECGFGEHGSWANWVVREMLPSIKFGVCPNYGDMPLAREFRFFVRDGDVICWHPYWPTESLEQGRAENFDYEALCRMDNEAELRALASAAGKAVGGEWSVDLLHTERGWFVIDMAEAGKSYHWDGCTSELAT